jgi:hypothetical protein
MSAMKGLSKNKKWLLLTTAITFVLQQGSSVHGMDSPDDQQAMQEVPSVPLVTPHNFDLQMEPPNLSSKVLYSKQIKDLPEALREEQNRLHQSLLISLEAKEDLWSPLIQEIKKAFRTESSMIQGAVKEIFPNLVEPALSLWPPDFLRKKKHEDLLHASSLPPEHPSFERINEVISILEILEKNRVFPLKLLSKLQILRETYRTYRTKLCEASPLERLFLLSPILMKTEFSDKTYLISEGKAHGLLSINTHGVASKKNKTGSSIVTHIGEIYAKQNLIKKRQDGSQEGTLNPSLEWGMSAFHRLLFGEGLVSSSLVSFPYVPVDRSLPETKLKEQQELIKNTEDINLAARDRDATENRLYEDISFKSTNSYNAQITAEVEGEFIEDFLRKASRDVSLFEELDPYNLQGLLLSSLLTNPADAKGDNLIVTSPDPTGRRKIISIDNDLALSSFIIEEQPNYHSLEARNILFAIPRFMEQAIEESVKQRFLSHNPYLFLLRWLKALDYHQQQYKALLEQNFIDKQAYDNLSLPLQLKGETIKHVLEKFLTLQKLISSSDSVSFQQLFEELSPLAAQTYKILREHHDPLRAFEIIYRQDKFLEEILKAGEKKEVQALLDKEHSLKNAYKGRAQSLEEAVVELCEATDLSQLKEAIRLQFFEEVYLSFPSVLKAVKHPSWHDSSLLYLGAGFPISSPTLEFLIQKFSQYINQVDEERGTPLHYVMQQERNRAHQFAGILLAKGANPEVKNAQGLTPLDASLEKGFYEVAELFVAVGAGHMLNNEIGLKFFREFSKKPDSSQFQTLQQLLRRNQIFAWKALWDSLSITTLSEKDLKIQTASLGEQILPECLLECLFPYTATSNPRMLKKTEKYGNSAVAKVEWKGHSFYFKEAPAFPGLEYAVSHLIHTMIGFGSPLSEFTLISGIPYLISQGIEGKNLRDVLDNDPTLQTIYWKGKRVPLEWDENSLSLLTIILMMINPEDGRADNYVIQEHPDKPGKFQLICIDNDQAFVPGIAKDSQQKNVIQVKCLPFCFPHMQTRIPTAVKNHFAQKEPYEVLFNWLTILEKFHACLVKMNQQDRLIQKKNTSHFNLEPTYPEKKTYYGVPFVPNMLGRLYERMKKIHQIFNKLETPQDITHYQLLEEVDWLLARRYAPRKYKCILDRFQDIEESADEMRSSTTAQALLRGLEIPFIQDLKQAVDYHKEIEPIEALREMLETAKNRTWKDMAPILKTFREILTPEGRAQFIQEKIRFNRLNVPETQAWIETIGKSDTSDLTIIKSPVLTPEMFFSQGSLFQKLEQLSLRGCSKMHGDQLILSLSQNCKALQTLDLSGTLLQHFDIVSGNLGSSLFNWRQPIGFPSLRGLLLNQCYKLETISLIAPLESLEVRNCRSLITVNLQEDFLKKLAIEDCSKLSSDFVLGCFQKGIKISLNQFTAYPESNQIFKIFPEYPEYKEKRFGGYDSRIFKISSHGSGHKSLFINRHNIGNHFVLAALLNFPSIKKISIDFFQPKKYWGEEKDIERQTLSSLGEDLTALTLLSMNTNLKSLKISNNNIDYNSINILTRNKELKSLSLINDNLTDDMISLLEFNSILKKLNLSKNKISDIGAESIARNTNITELDLSSNNIIGGKGIEALACSPSLKKLRLQRRQAEWNWLGTKQKAQLVMNIKALAYSASIVDLDLGNNEITLDDISVFSNNMTLRSLALYKCGVTDQGASLIAQNSSITDLNLHDNQIGDKGAIQLSFNTTFLKLNLSENNIGDPGAKALAHNTTILSLDLSNSHATESIKSICNHIGDLGAEAFALNPVLTELHLQHNKIRSDKGVNTFKKNTTLLVLTLTTSSDKAFQNRRIWK